MKDKKHALDLTPKEDHKETAPETDNKKPVKKQDKKITDKETSKKTPSDSPEEEENLYAENALELSGMTAKEKRAYKRQLNQKRLAAMDKKERKSYLIRYYKWHAIAAIFGVFLVGWLIHTIYVANLPQELVVAITNDGINATAEQYIPDAFREYYNLDTKNIIHVFTDLTIDSSEDITIQQTTLTDYEKMMVYISSDRLDAIIGDEKALNYYKSTGDIAIIDSCLDAELYEALSAHIVNASDETGYMKGGEAYAAAIDISGTDFVKRCNLSYNTVYLMIPNNRYTNNSATIRLIRLIFNLES